MSEWTEARLRGLVGSEESLTIEFKSGDLLQKSSNDIARSLSKAVSGMANAQGGQIIIGMDEEKRGKVRVAARLGGISLRDWPKDRLEQVITSNVQPPLRIRIDKIALPAVGPDHGAYVIHVPEGATAHQANDCIYYGRSELSTNPLRDYEVRLRMNRATILSAMVATTITSRRHSSELKNEQRVDFQSALEGLASAVVSKSVQYGAQKPAGYDDAEAKSLSPRWRFHEFEVTFVLYNTCERTIREFELRAELNFPNGWLLTSAVNMQPRGGFSSVEEIGVALQGNEVRVHASAPSPYTGVSGRILPGMCASVASRNLLIPEASQFMHKNASIEWFVYLDDSPVSQGAIDFRSQLAEVWARQYPES